MSPDDLFDSIATELTPQGATTSAFFGKRALKAHGKAFACLKDDRLACRLGDGTPDHQTAIALSEAVLFEPCAGRTFKDWVAVPISHGEQWLHFAGVALNRLTT
jgi:hypothetical protein